MIGLGYSARSRPPSSGATCWRTRPGTRRTRPTSPRSARAASRPCSTSRPWSRTSPACRSPARRCWTKPPPRPRRWPWRTGCRGAATRSSSTPTRCPRPGRRAHPRAAARPARGRARPRRAAARRRRFGVLAQYPGASGEIRDLTRVVAAAHERGALVIVAADLLALTLLRTPGEFGADIAVGTTQRFGVPLGFGGPHAGYLAVRSGLERQLPGRLVGVSSTPAARPPTGWRCRPGSSTSAARRRPRTSAPRRCCSPCMASMYAVYHGPDGLRASRGGCTATPPPRRRPARPAVSTSPTCLLRHRHRVRPRARRRGRHRGPRAGINLRLVDADTSSSRATS